MLSLSMTSGLPNVDNSVDKLWGICGKVMHFSIDIDSGILLIRSEHSRQGYYGKIGGRVEK